MELRPLQARGRMKQRTNEVALRAVQTQDFMTAHWAHLPHELLGRVSNRIINEVRGINRVVYDKAPETPRAIGNRPSLVSWAREVRLLGVADTPCWI